MHYLPDTQAGIDRLDHINFEENINRSAEAYKRRLHREGRPATYGAITNLELRYQSQSLYKWFSERDMFGFLANAWVLSKCDVMAIHTRPTSTSGCSADGRKLLYALLVNDMELLHWHKQFTLPFLGGGVNERLYKQPYDYQHLCLQIRLALQQDLDLLGERSEHALSVEPKKNKLYRVDYQFFKGFALRDSNLMQAALDELLTPKVLRHRHGDWPRESYFFAAWAMIYYKLAQLAGFELEVDNPWMPKAWLPVLSMESIPSSFDFIDEFDIFTPFFDNPDSQWCKNASQFTPRRAQEPLLMFREVEAAFAGLEYKGGV